MLCAVILCFSVELGSTNILSKSVVEKCMLSGETSKVLNRILWEKLMSLIAAMVTSVSCIPIEYF